MGEVVEGDLVGVGCGGQPGRAVGVWISEFGRAGQAQIVSGWS
jgi:hypothetical protein